MGDKGRLMMFGIYALAIAWPVMEMVLLAAQGAAKGDPTREERAKRLSSGVKNVGRSVVFLFSAFVFMALGKHAPVADPGAVSETGARLMRAVPAFFALCSFVSVVMVLRCAVLGAAGLRARPRASEPGREG